MPVTTKLLQRLHETLGDDATNDLLAWWDEAATVNRAAVREVADLYFERFSAQLDKELAAVRLEMGNAFAAERVEREKGFAAVKLELAELRTEMANQRADLIKWMFLFWIGTVVPLAGLLVALTKL